MAAHTSWQTGFLSGPEEGSANTRTVWASSEALLSMSGQAPLSRLPFGATPGLVQCWGSEPEAAGCSPPAQAGWKDPKGPDLQLQLNADSLFPLWWESWAVLSTLALQ